MYGQPEGLREGKVIKKQGWECEAKNVDGPDGVTLTKLDDSKGPQRRGTVKLKG